MDRPTTDVSDTDFRDEVLDPKTALINQAGPFQWIQVISCTGLASATLRRENTSNEFESWRKLYNRHHIPSKARAVGRLTKILEPSGMERGHFGDTLAAWTYQLLRYEKGHGFKVE